MTKEKTKKRLGRPLAFDTPEEMQEAIERYFNSISRTVAITELDSDGKKVSVVNDNSEPMYHREWISPPTLSGLNNYLGIVRDTWAEYCKKEEFSDITARAKQIVEEYLEQQLPLVKNSRGIEFNLINNFGGWKNSKEIELGKYTRDTVEKAALSVADKYALLGEVAEIFNSSSDGGAE